MYCSSTCRSLTGGHRHYFTNLNYPAVPFNTDACILSAHDRLRPWAGEEKEGRSTVPARSPG